MNQKEMIEQFKANIPEFSGTDEEIEIKKALYLYINLGKIKSFDEKYYYGNSETQKNIYALAQYQAFQMRLDTFIQLLLQKRGIIL